MTKQKRGLWVFIFSLIPGAGEMYMGFRRQGISIMLLFWAIIAVSAGTGMGWFLMFLPVLWFYSFFNVHNLKSLTEEEFYSIEDTYILHLDELLGDADGFFQKHRTLTAVVLIVLGVSILWNNFLDLLYWFLPSYIVEFMSNLNYRLPQIIMAVAIIAAGMYILSRKKQELESSIRDESEKEHYWEPYRPYQQPQTPQDFDSHEASQPKDSTCEAPSSDSTRDSVDK